MVTALHPSYTIYIKFKNHFSIPRFIKLCAIFIFLDFSFSVLSSSRNYNNKQNVDRKMVKIKIGIKSFVNRNVFQKYYDFLSFKNLVGRRHD